ncbi:MAG: hypothetical protein CVV07_11020 [Gammaproteobacteria bacterium HGW-Gammaproteobacteria-11]|nr:MAG: hypothetical protein CVV07_11020 [Gammaproteobacteria bacterium HGW-Gammaproteobacteria-11]
MKSKDKVVTPLHLLQGLTQTLNAHLSEACDQALKDARKALEKLNKQQTKLEEKRAEAESRLAVKQASDQKGVGKAAEKLTALRQAETELLVVRKSVEAYTRQLQSDVRQTLRIAKGLQRIEEQASVAIDKRNNPAAPATRPRRKPKATA